MFQIRVVCNLAVTAFTGEGRGKERGHTLEFQSLHHGLGKIQLSDNRKKFSLHSSRD